MELNPNHPTTRKLNEHWQKIAGLLLVKLGGEVVITPSDIEKSSVEGIFVTVEDRLDGIHLRVVDEKTAHKLAAQAGGLPH